MTNSPDRDVTTVPKQWHLLELISTFNLSPVHYIHDTWLRSTEHGSMIVSLRQKENSHYRLSRYLLEYFDLNEQFYYDFDSPEKRIGLVGIEELSELLLYIGLVLNEKIIRSVVLRSQRQQLEQCLGAKAHYFAVKKAQFLSSQNYSWSAAVTIDWDNIEKLKPALMAVGLKVLSMAYTDMPIAFKKRLSLKFPQSWSQHLSQLANNPTEQAQGRQLLIKSYKEVNRQWQHLLY